jgi:hypothetical protein
MLTGKLAVGARIQFYSPVTQIQWDAGQVNAQRRLTTRAVIITASTGVLGSGKINSAWSACRVREAIGKLRLGSYDRVARVRQ